MFFISSDQEHVDIFVELISFWYNKNYLIKGLILSKIYLIIVIFLVSSRNASDDIKIKDVCKWYHEEILGWHQNYLLFKKRHTEVSDKSKYQDTNDKTIQRYLIKQKKLVEAIGRAEKKIQNFSKVYHYLECTRFEKKFEKD